MMKLKKKSAWKYGASAGGDIGLFVANVSKGFLEIERNNGARSEGSTLYYTGAGLGISKGMPVSITFSTTDKDFVSVGDIFVSDNVSSDDLQIKDFEGLCFIHSVSVNLFMGGSHNMLFFGIPWNKVPKQVVQGVATNVFDVKRLLVGPAYQGFKALKWLLDQDGDIPSAILPLAGQAKGVVISKGVIAGPSATAGISGMFGYISAEPDGAPWEGDTPLIPSREEHSTKSATASHDETWLRIPGDALFGFDKHTIGSGDGGLHKAEEALGSVASYIRMTQPKQLYAEGHTDSVGGPAYNKKLSLRRAEAVRTWLLTKGKITGIPITPAGLGEEFPVAENSTPSGRQLNRRVVLRIHNP